MIGFFIVGGILTVLGIVNMRGNISTIHWYNRARVTRENAPKYGKWVGSGTLTIGAGMILSGLIRWLTGNAVWTVLILPGCAAGLALILIGQFKYNKGLF